MTGPMVLAEVAEVLAQHGSLPCGVAAAIGRQGVTLTVTLAPDAESHEAHLRAFDLYNALVYLQDVASLRALCEKYDIDPAALERLLPKEGP